MNATYGKFSSVCARFYDLVHDPEFVANFVGEKVRAYRTTTALFVGSFFLVAKYLIESGIDVIVSDLSNEMLIEGRSRLPSTTFIQADLKDLPFCNQFDLVMVIGRVFTHMLTDADVDAAIKSIYKCLKTDGIAFIDNYEDLKILKTSYFNGTISVSDGTLEIDRESSLDRVSEQPYLVNWRARYLYKENSQSYSFEDQMMHRAFSRSEFTQMLTNHRFTVAEQGDNFDDTSFYSLAKKSKL